MSVAIDPTRELDHRSPAPVSGSNRIDRAPLAVAGVAVAAYVLWQLREANSYAAMVHDPRQLPYFVVFSIVPYLGLVSSSVLAVAAGRPRMAVLPPIVYVLVGWSTSLAAGNVVLGIWPTGPTAALAISFTLSFVPCLAVAVVGIRRRPGPTLGADALGLIVVAGLVMLTIVLRGVVTGFEWDHSLETVAVAVLAGVSVSSRPLLLPFAMAVAWSMSAEPLQWLASGFHGAMPAESVLLAATAVLAGAAYRPSSVLVDRLSRTPFRLVIAVNILNIADALATSVAIGSGRGAEANPIVDLVGLPAKVVIGLAASILVSRHRPKALIAPLVALALVFTWHLVGLIVI